MSIFEHLPGALRWLRIQRKLTQADLARRVDLSRSRLSAYERGDSAPPLATLDRILTALPADTSDLVAALEVAAMEPGVARRRYRPSSTSEAPAGHPERALTGLRCFLEAVAIEASRGGGRA